MFLIFDLYLNFIILIINFQNFDQVQYQVKFHLLHLHKNHY